MKGRTFMRRHTIALRLGLLAGLLALSAAACSDDSGDDGGVPSVDGTASETAAAEGDGEELDGFEEALAYSECMRDNGITDFPDPERNGEGGIGLSLPEGTDPEDEDFKAAEDACKDLMPGPEEGATIDPDMYDALLEYSECMRENGITAFPDPEPNGGIIMNGDMGFDPQSEEFQAADEACADLRPERGGEPGTDSEDE
jgi:hypothetical protein